MEYVFDMGRCAVEGRCGEVPRVTMGMDARRERVVRCRDCGHSRRDGWECWRFVDDPEEDFERISIAAPYGFCAWGERGEK